MKGFSHQLTELNDGATHAALTADLHELIKSVQAMGKGGSLTLKVKVAPAVRNTRGSVEQVIISTDRKLELPKPEQPADFFWLTDDGQTSRQHPRQHDLPLREVSTPPTGEIKAVDADGVIQFREPGQAAG